MYFGLEALGPSCLRYELRAQPLGSLGFALREHFRLRLARRSLRELALELGDSQRLCCGAGFELVPPLLSIGHVRGEGVELLAQRLLRRRRRHCRLPRDLGADLRDVGALVRSFESQLLELRPSAGGVRPQEVELIENARELVVAVDDFRRETLLGGRSPGDLVTRRSERTAQV